MGMLSLGKVYASGIPVLDDWGFFGAVILGTILIFVFLGVGWLYDVKGRLWSPSTQSAAERDAYKYLPNIKTYTIDYPSIYSLLNTMKGIIEKLGLNTERIDELALYMSKYYGRAPERKDILQADKDANEYIKDHPFQMEEIDKPKISLIAKAKLVFTTNTLRLSWIQDLTGMLQDALVFAAVYVVFIFPDVAVNGIVPLFYLGLGFILLSLPMLFAQTSIGWVYDKKFRVWSVMNVVNVERSPYTYVAFPRQYQMDFPFYYAFLESLRGIYIALNMDSTKIDLIMDYIGKYGTFRASHESDFAEAQKLRRELGKLFTPIHKMEDSR